MVTKTHHRSSADGCGDELVQRRLAAERGALYGHGARAIALTYACPYAVGMSSLGFQQVYRILNGLPDTVAERAFLPDTNESGRGPILTYESRRPISDFSVVAIAIACEQEILGVFEILARAGIPFLASERSDSHPWIVVGGPLTFSNPRPLAPFADVVVMGEAEDSLASLCDIIFSGNTREAIKESLAAIPGFFVPSIHGAEAGELARARETSLPALSSIVTNEATLGAMTLIEIERGCSRGCTFCVMRRSECGMRSVAPDRVLGAIPKDSLRVGLVGAAVSDHPRLIDIVEPLVARGCQVSLSSLRADRLTPALAELLVRGGAKTLTVAADGASERLRQEIGKGITAQHLVAAATLAGVLGLARLKCYAMIGLPGESDDDIDELAALAGDLASAAGKRTRVVLGVSTFVPKLRTPLASAAFVGVRIAAARLARLRRKLGTKVEVRADSTRWAWVEYVLAQGGAEAGLMALAAFRAGGDLRAFKNAFS